jgi:hypothetical protein
VRHDPTAAQRRYWSEVASLGCVVCGGLAQIAHVAGKPSVTARMQEPKAKGLKLRRYHWLVLPVCDWHANRSVDALDLNPRLWEERYGPVAGHIDRISASLGVPVWQLAQEGRK